MLTIIVDSDCVINKAKKWLARKGWPSWSDRHTTYMKFPKYEVQIAHCQLKSVWQVIRWYVQKPYSDKMAQELIERMAQK